MMSGKSKFQISHSLDERIKRIIGGTNEYDTEFDHVTSAYILGFNYGNITNCVGLTTNYQLHHAVFPVVGLVFFKTSPTDDDIKTNLKSVKEFSSSPNGLGSFGSDKNEHLFLIYNVNKESNEVEKRIFNFSKGSFVRRRRLRLSILNDPSIPRQVQRGSEDIFTLGDGDSLSSAEDEPVDHLIFFIHGVGGVCDVRFRSCVEVVADFKKMANNLLAQHSSPSSGASTPTSNAQLAQTLKKGFFRKMSSESSRGSVDNQDDSRQTNQRTWQRRVECLPISWHSCTRRQTGMNDQLGMLALGSVPKLRHFLNKVVMDALLYSCGPVYGQTILNNVGDEINRLYTLFMEKHPTFSGSVSLAGHSLGSVIVFDLLANQVPHHEPTLTTPSKDSQDNCQISASDNSNNNSIHLTNEANDLKAKQNIDFINMRKQCLNVSHDHHDLEPANLSGCCTDYKNLEELLKDMDLTQYVSLFHKEHIDINTLLLLTDLDMKELKLPLGARRKLCTYINFKKVSQYQEAVLRQQSTENNTQQHEQSSSSETQKMQSSILLRDLNTGQYLLKYPQLKFKPRCFFSFGSPMPMFLTVRGIGNISKEYKLPTCDRMFNIYHSLDPLAYRLEPLLDPRFKKIEPIQIPHRRGGKRIHVQLLEGMARVSQDFKRRFLGADESAKGNSQELSDFDCTKIGKLNGGRRLDYVLQEKPIELFNEYIFAFTSHANYWQHEDSALMMLNEIYQVDGIQLFDLER